MTTQTPSTPMQGYSRAEVDEFLAAASAERVRLESEIDDLQGRISRARSAIGMHRVMVAMLIDAQRELTDIREAAAAEAERIVRQAEGEVAAIPPAPVAPHDAPLSTTIARDESIDLVTGPLATASSPSPASNGSLSITGVTAGDDDYMEFLRGALSDDSPLGPSGE